MPENNYPYGLKTLSSERIKEIQSSQPIKKCKKCKRFAVCSKCPQNRSGLYIDMGIERIKKFTFEDFEDKIIGSWKGLKGYPHDMRRILSTTYDNNQKKCKRYYHTDIDFVAQYPDEFIRIIKKHKAYFVLYQYLFHYCSDNYDACHHDDYEDKLHKYTYFYPKKIEKFAKEESKLFIENINKEETINTTGPFSRDNWTIICDDIYSKTNSVKRTKIKNFWARCKLKGFHSSEYEDSDRIRSIDQQALAIIARYMQLTYDTTYSVKWSIDRYA